MTRKRPDLVFPKTSEPISNLPREVEQPIDAYPICTSWLKLNMDVRPATSAALGPGGTARLPGASARALKGSRQVLGSRQSSSQRKEGKSLR